MNALLADLGRTLWRLAPANPILLRVVHAGGRRKRHLWIRAGYLAILAGIVGMGVVFLQTSGATSLAELAKSATRIFQYVAYTQLVMVCLLAPIMAAAAITQERDAQTFNILIATPLTNAQIVLGALLSRMYFVFVLLLAGVPLFCIMMVYGGVTLREIALSTGVAATSAIAAGSLAIFVSVIRIGTRQTLVYFYAALGLYLISVWVLSGFAYFAIPEAAPLPGESVTLSWLAAFHPLLSLFAILNETPAPALGLVSHHGFPWTQFAAYPAQSYLLLTLLLSLLLGTASVYFVRASISEGEPTWFNRFFFFLGRRPKDDASDELRRRPRRVWTNAVAWREAMTSAARGGRMIQRVAVMSIGLVAAVALLYLQRVGQWPVATTRSALQSLLSIEMGLSLLVATNTAATALTREKEAGTLDILLLTPLVSRDILWGKIRGLISFAVPMIVIPFGSLLLFVGYDLVTHRSGASRIAQPEALILIPLLMACFSAFACALGLQASVTARRTVQAVIQSVGIFLIVCAVTGTCFTAIGKQTAEVGAILMPFSPVAAPFVLIDPSAWLMNVTAGSPDLSKCRILAAGGCVAACLLYAGVAYAMLQGMIRNFDMIIRRQTT